MESDEGPTLGGMAFMGDYAQEAKLEYGGTRGVDWSRFTRLVLMLVVAIAIMALAAKL